MDKSVNDEALTNPEPSVCVLFFQAEVSFRKVGSAFFMERYRKVLWPSLGLELMTRSADEATVKFAQCQDKSQKGLFLHS